jgi:crotonobetainyl-CoA:carnitine CoA-transferase CaiB-like acyl-CoA transferase
MHTTLLDGVHVLQLGERLAARICAGLLASAGASVRTLATTTSPEDTHALRDALQGVQLIIGSSDAGNPESAAVYAAARRLSRELAQADRQPEPVACDITAAGATGPYSGLAYSDAEIQALTGLMDTTGFPGQPPSAIGLPYCEVSAGIYAAAAATAALLLRRRHGVAQDVDVALYDSATNALTTFLPHVFNGRDPHRLGNRHSSAAPWNAYRTRDGWILICTSTQEQWSRLSAVIDSEELRGPAFAQPGDRVRNALQLDALIEQWTHSLDTPACLALCEQADIPAGPIIGVAQLADEANVRHRGMAAGDGAGTPFRMAPFGQPPDAADENAPGASRSSASAESAFNAATAGPLAGIRVIEIGQYTTAPLVGKHLAALGAEVIKIEPPGGDPTRRWPHGQGDTSYFFALSNTDKLSVTADLKSADGREKLRRLLAGADVLVENLRPGALARLGFDTATLARINPRLVYCGISGFGADSAYPGRPAFDTVIQAMGGFMDLTRSSGVPTKAGISAADILSGQVALFSVLAALYRRDQSRRGGSIDIAMQDVAVWATRTCATAAPAEQPLPRVLACADGYLLVSGGAQDSALLSELPQLDRSAAVAHCALAGLRAVPVKSVANLMQDPRFRARGLALGLDNSGRYWPVLPPPYRLSRSPGPIGKVLAEAGADTQALFDPCILAG